MPVRDRTPDFLVYMLSACALRAKAAVAASSVVARTIVESAGVCSGSGKRWARRTGSRRAYELRLTSLRPVKLQAVPFFGLCCRSGHSSMWGCRGARPNDRILGAICLELPHADHTPSTTPSTHHRCPHCNHGRHGAGEAQEPAARAVCEAGGAAREVQANCHVLV
jgi:hypothetical protein